MNSSSRDKMAKLQGQVRAGELPLCGLP